MTTPRTVLISGANRGIGLETTRQLAALGWRVWLGSRDLAAGEAAAATLKDDGLRVTPIQLDVTDDASVEAARETLTAEGGIDVLVNNAGISGGWPDPEAITPADFLPVFGVNLLGPVRLIHAFLPMLLDRQGARVVNVSSGMGSFTITTDPQRFESTLHSVVYPASKAALNMVTSQYAKAFAGRLDVVAVDPGYTATDFNGHRGIQPVEVGAGPIVAAVTRSPDLPSVPFSGQDGPIGW